MNWHEYEYHAPRPHFRFGPKLTPTVKALILVNVAVFILQRAVLNRTGAYVYLCAVPALLIGKLFIWQLFTYMFLHGTVLHILFNMFVLWMFGSDLESRLGRSHFLQLYFLSAISSWGSQMPMLGASGAIFGVLIAFAMLFPNRYLILLPFPMMFKAKYLVLGYAIATILFLMMSAPGDNVAHFAHLGGLLFGYIYMRLKFGLRLPYAFANQFSDALKRRWLWRKRPKYKYTPIDAEEFIDREVDPILAKISRSGMSSLTRRERKILKKARSHMK